MFLVGIPLRRMILFRPKETLIYLMLVSVILYASFIGSSRGRFLNDITGHPPFWYGDL